MKNKIILGLAVTILAFGLLIGFGSTSEAQDSATDLASITELLKSVTSENAEIALKLVNTFLPMADDILGASGTRWKNGISADSTSPVAGEVRGTTFTSTGAVTFASGSVTGAFDGGKFTQGGGTLASTTGASSLLLEADLLSYNNLAFAPLLVATTATTLTFPASTTLTTLIPNDGDAMSYWLSNATGTPSALTLAGNTGTILKNNSSSASTLEGKFTQFDLVRQANSDVFLYWNNN